MPQRESNKSFGVHELFGTTLLAGLVLGGFLGGSVYAREQYAQKKVEHTSVYVKCYQIAQFIKDQEEDMGSKTTLPDRLLLRCEELSNG